MSSSAWANSTTYYAKLTVGTSDNSPIGAGTVYASTNEKATSGEASVVGSASSDGKSAEVTVYGFAKANTGYAFKGWSTNADGSGTLTTGTTYTYTVKSSCTSNPPTDSSVIKTIYGVFAKIAYQPFDIVFSDGSYTVDGQSPKNITGLTEVTSLTLATTDETFIQWKITRIDGSVEKIKTNPYELTCIGKTDASGTISVEAEFMTADKVAVVSTKAELVTALANTAQYLKVQIDPAATITIPADEKVTVPSGMNLAVDGQLILEGELANSGEVTGSGTITAFKKLVTQTGANGDTPFETTSVVASNNKKYYKTTIGSLSGKISGTAPTCTVQNAAKVVRNGVTIAQCVWPSTVTPAVLCCTINSSKAVNCITGFLDPCYNTDAAKGMATVKDKATTQMLVLLATKKLDNSACSNGGLLAPVGNYQKLQGNFGTMDLAGATLTMSPSYIDNYTHTLLNGELSVTTLMYSGTLNCINLSSLSLSKLKEDYASVINIYDCNLGSTKVPKGYNGSNANKNKVNFYSSGDNIYSTSSNFNTLNQKSVYKIYGGRWSAKPAADYNGAGSDYDFYQTSDTDTSYSLKLKTDQTVVTFDDGSKYESLADAFVALSTMTASSAKMTMVKNATLANAVTIPAGKTVEIELDGCCITASNGFVINNGTFLIGDRRGNIAADGGRVITSSGNFLVNNGTAEITYGYYTGNVVLNGGELTTHYGRFTGNFSAATGVDKTVVANFRGGYFDKDVSSFLRAGYFRVSGYVGAFPKPAITTSWVSSNGGYWKVNAKLLSAADDAIYKTSSTTKESYTLANWKRRGEIISMVTPYFTYTIDVAVGFDRTTTKDDVYADIAKPSLGANELTDTVQAGGLYRVLSEQLAHPTSSLLSPASQKKYTDALTESTYKEMEFGVYSSKDVDKGTTANLRIDLCTGSSGTNIDNLRSVYALMSEYVVIGAGKTNQAMIQPESDKATFYATIAEAVAACEEGDTVKLCNNIDSTDEITISKAVTIDTNGMEFKGKFVAGTNYKMKLEETVLDIEKYLGKKHCTYTFELDAIPFTLPEVENATVTADPESPVAPNMEVTFTVKANDGYVFIDESTEKAFTKEITKGGKVEVPIDVTTKKKAYVPAEDPTDPTAEIKIDIVPTSGGEAQAVPVKVTELIVKDLVEKEIIKPDGEKPTAAEVSAGLNTTQANDLTVWQNVVMGVDGTTEANEFSTIGEKGVKVVDEEEVEVVVVKTPIEKFNPAGDMNVTVTYTLLRSNDGGVNWSEVKTGLTKPEFNLGAGELGTGDALWKFKAVFETSGGVELE